MQPSSKEHIPIILQLPNKSTSTNNSIEYSITTIKGDSITTIIITPKQINQINLDSVSHQKNYFKTYKSYENLNFNKTCFTKLPKKNKEKETSFHVLFGQQKKRKTMKKQEEGNSKPMKNNFFCADLFDQSLEVQSRFQTDLTSQQSSEVSQSQILQSPNSLKPIFKGKQLQRSHFKTMKNCKSEPLIEISKKCQTINRLKYQLQQLEDKVSLLRQQNQKMSKNPNIF